MTKFQYQISIVNEQFKNIMLNSYFSRLTIEDQMAISLLISSEQHSQVNINWYKGNAILKSCIVTNNIADDICKILDKYK